MSQSILAALVFAAVPLSAASVNTEIRLGNFLDQQRFNQHLLVLDEPLNAKLNEIGEKVACQTLRRDLKFTFRIVNDPLVNACATSGGFIYVNTGLLDVLESQDELAAVIAHEVSHISETHLLRSIQSAENKRLAAAVLRIALQVGLGYAGATAGAATGVPSGAQQLGDFGGQVGQVLGPVIDHITYSSMLGYAKNLENEADRQAVAYLIGAGYDPYALIRVFKKLQTIREKLVPVEGIYPSQLINKEPGLDERINQIERLLSSPLKK